MRLFGAAFGCALAASLAFAESSFTRGDRDALAAAFGFSEGLEPIRTAIEPGRAARASDCGACHVEEHTQWRASRHASAFSNAVFQEGLRREPAMRCVHCHAPSREQAREVAAALPKGSFLERRSALQAKPLNVPSKSRAHDGVDCVACHVRDGQVLTTNTTTQEAEGHVVSPMASALSDSAFCGTCHQFRFHELHEGKTVLADLLIQSTFDEWKDYAAAGGEGTCQSCHMKDGSHEVLGTRHLDFMRSALQVEVVPEAGVAAALELRSNGVGHHFPSGDVFRHLTVEVDRGDAQWTELAWIGRRYEPRENPATGRTSMSLVLDSALRPGERRRIELPSGSRRFRVQYHYISDEPEARTGLRDEDVSAVIAEGVTEPAPHPEDVSVR